MDSIIFPISSSAEDEETAALFASICAMFGLKALPALFKRLAVNPTLLRDIEANLSAGLREGRLPPRAKGLIVTGVAIASGSGYLLDLVEQLGRHCGLHERDFSAVLGVVSAQISLNILHQYRESLSEAIIERTVFPNLQVQALVQAQLAPQESACLCVAMTALGHSRFCAYGGREHALAQGLSDALIGECVQLAAVFFTLAQLAQALGLEREIGECAS